MKRIKAAPAYYREGGIYYKIDPVTGKHVRTTRQHVMRSLSRARKLIEKFRGRA